MSGVSVPSSRELNRDWQAVLGRLELELNPRTFDGLRGTRPVCIDGTRLIVETHDNLALPWLNERLAFVVRRSLADVFQDELDVEFVGRGSNPHKELSCRASEEIGEADTSCDSVSSVPQIIGRVNRRYVLEHYVPAHGNRLALDTCLAMLAGDDAAPGAVAIWGGPGLGKTHLLHGVAQRAQMNGWRIACLNAEDFTTRYQKALRARDVHDFQLALRDVQLFILDDLQYLVGKRATQDELVHTIDAVCDQGGHVLVAGELHPLELDLPERLTSRLSSGVVARIEPFNMSERRVFVANIARRQRAGLPVWAIDRIAALGDLPIRLVQGAVHCAIALQRSELLDAGRLDVELSSLAISEFAPGNVTTDEVLEAVARHYEATVEDLRGRSRKPALANARAVAAAVLQDRGKSLAEIGAMLGGRNRTTLSPIVNRGRRMLDAEPDLRRRLVG